MPSNSISRYMLVQEFLERSARRFPGKEALVAGDTRLTYEALDQMANRFAHALLESGVEYGDRVAVLMDNTAEAVVSMWGALKAGATFLIINPTTKTRKVTYILNNCRAAALAIQQTKLRTAGEAISDTPSLKSVFVVGKKTPSDDAAAGSSHHFVPWTEAVWRTLKTA